MPAAKNHTKTSFVVVLVPEVIHRGARCTRRVARNKMGGKKQKKVEIRPHSLVRPPIISSYNRLTVL